MPASEYEFQNGHLVWIVTAYSGTALALEKAVDEKFHLLEKDAEKRRDELNEDFDKPIYRTEAVFVNKAVKKATINVIEFNGDDGLISSLHSFRENEAPFSWFVQRLTPLPISCV